MSLDLLGGDLIALNLPCTCSLLLVLQDSVSGAFTLSDTKHAVALLSVLQDSVDGSFTFSYTKHTGGQLSVLLDSVGGSSTLSMTLLL